MRINTSSLFITVKNNLFATQGTLSNKLNPSFSNQKPIFSLYGGDSEVTRDNVLLHKYRQANPIKLFENNQKYKPVNNVSDIPQEFIDSINDKEYSWDQFRLLCALDINPYGDDLNYTLDRLAASYVAVSDHLNNHFSGDELKEHMDELDAIVSNIKNTAADYFSHSVGGFLEKNGFLDEEEKIRNIIISEYDHKVDQYRDFISKNSNYANLKGTADEWLSDDVAYMAQELRKACDTSERTEASAEGSYNIEEISLACRLIKEIDGHGIINSLGNEESAGMMAGMMLLKTNLFAEQSAVSGQLANKITTAVNTYIDRAIDKVNTRKLSLYDDPYYDKDRSPIYDKSAIYEISNMMLSLYKMKANYSEAILEGIQYALDKSNSKENPGGMIDRYKDNVYWNRFFDNSELYGQFYYSESFDKRTSFQEIVDLWNSFAFDITKINDNQIKLNNLSVLA